MSIKKLSAILLFALTTQAQIKVKNPTIPSLNECGEPIAMHVSESDSLMSASTSQLLQEIIEAKGHRMTTDKDLDRRLGTLKENSYVYRRDAGLNIAIYSKNPSLKFPMDMKSFKATHAHESLENPLVNTKVLDRIYNDLYSIDRKRLFGTITEEEKNRTIASFFNEDIFVSDSELEGLQATFLMAFSPHQVQPKFTDLYWLEPGQGNDEQNWAVGYTVPAVEAKRRARKSIHFYNITIGELGRTHEVSDLPGILSRMLAPLDRVSAHKPEEIESFYRQFLSVLPQCKSQSH